MLEVIFVVAITGVVSAIAVPMMGNALGFFRLDGDARSLKNSVSTARMQAAANFAETRIYLDYTTSAYHLESKASSTAPWVTQGGMTYLSAYSESYGFGVVGTAPPNTQATIGQSGNCLNNATPAVAIASTSCIVFNSRGIPIDANGAPLGTNALYMTDGTSVYGLTVSATSSIKLWKTLAKATPSWIQQ
jgi:Tfp pilus assembly protein FimT